MEKPKLNTVEVIISGEIVSLTAEEPEEYILRVARYLDKKIADIQKEKQVLGINSFMKTMLIAVNITDDLFKEIDKNEALEKDVARLQEENTLLNEKLRELQMARTNELAAGVVSLPINNEAKNDGAGRPQQHTYKAKHK